jgi:hypothetical protein
MALIKGILSFPTLFTPKVAKGGTEAKYGVTVLIPPHDPQVAVLNAEVEAAKLNGCPSGYNGADECFKPYDEKYKGKDYYDPKFSGWYAFSCTAKADDKPPVVNMAHEPIINPGDVFSGMVGYVSAGISYYPKGKAGIGGWLNGVMITAEEPPMGRLDGKPSVDQMFTGIGEGSPSAPPAAPNAPTPSAPPAAPAPTPQYVMTPKAQGTREWYLSTPGWTDELLISEGLMLPPGGVQPSFA